MKHRPQNKGQSAVNDHQILHLDHRKSLICEQSDCPLFVTKVTLKLIVIAGERLHM